MMSTPTSSQRRIWSIVALASDVGVLVIVWTDTGASPPTATLPTMGLFGATIVCSAAVIWGLIYDPAWVNDTQNWATLLSAGFPAVGTAIFGIRFQGDFGASALRSRSTAQTLAAIREQMAAGKPNLNRSADLMEQSARAMLGDLDEWRLIIQQLDLSVG